MNYYFIYITILNIRNNMKNPFTELLSSFENLSDLFSEKYDDVKANVKKYDFTTDEGYSKFIGDAAELRKSLEEYDTYFTDKMIDVLDSVVASATKKYTEHKQQEEAEAKKKEAEKQEKERLVKAEVERTRKENPVNTVKTISDIKVNIDDEDDGSIDYPSSHLTMKQRRQIKDLVDEYMDTKVIPYVNCSNESINYAADGLFEFAAWIINHK